MLCVCELAQNDKKNNEQAFSLAIIVPILNERERLPALLESLCAAGADELIIVDGQSTDGSWQWLQENGSLTHDSAKIGTLLIAQSEAGRARQLNCGVALAKSQTFLFLHADTNLPDQAYSEVENAMQSGKLWGWFSVRFIEHDWRMKVISFFMNKRSVLTSIATGDQALFVRRDLFVQVQGYDDIPLMEDIAICKQLMLYSRPYVSKLTVETSARRWLQRGVIKTVLMMWGFRLAYYFGVSAQSLAKKYHQVR